MATFNNSASYGANTKILHWLVAALFALQYSGAYIMTRVPTGQTVLGVSGDQYYNWHKSLGLVALFVIVLRLINRRIGQLPDWAPSLSEPERTFVHHVERGLYAAMLIMPLSGFLFVMAGGYGVLLFNVWPLPNPIGKIEWLSVAAEWTHIVAAVALAAMILGHLGLVLFHAIVRRDGLLRRML